MCSGGCRGFRYFRGLRGCRGLGCRVLGCKGSRRVLGVRIGFRAWKGFWEDRGL